MPAPKTYESFIENARTLVNKGDQHHQRLMHLLIEMEPLKLIWYGHPHRTWQDVLREERLCTFTAYTSFKKAVTYGIPVELVGVSAACLLAKKTKDVRTTVLRQTLKWVKTYQVPPNYQLVSEYVKQLTASERGPKKESLSAKLKAENTKLKAENAKLRARNAQLETFLRRSRLRIPNEGFAAGAL